VQGKEKICC